MLPENFIEIFGLFFLPSQCFFEAKGLGFFAIRFPAVRSIFFVTPSAVEVVSKQKRILAYIRARRNAI